MQKNIVFGASELHRCEDEYEFDLECARARLIEKTPETGLLSVLLAVVGEFVSHHGAGDLRHFLVLLQRSLDMSSNVRAAGLVSHYLDYGMRDERVSHCAYSDSRMAALSVHRVASRSSCVVRRARK